VRQAGWLYHGQRGLIFQALVWGALVMYHLQDHPEDKIERCQMRFAHTNIVAKDWKRLSDRSKKRQVGWHSFITTRSRGQRTHFGNFHV